MIQDIKKGKKISGMWLILAAAVLWGTTGTSQGLAPQVAHPVSVGAVRLLVGGAALLLIALGRGAFTKNVKWSIPMVLVSSFFVAAYQLCFFSGVYKTGVAVGTMVAIGSAPIAAGILGYFVRREKLRFGWYLATLLAIIGCLLLVLPGRGLKVDMLGIVLALGAGFSYATLTVSMKTLLETHAPDAVTTVVFLGAALLLSPVLFFYDCGWVFSTGGFVVALHLGIMATAVSYWLFSKGLQSVNVGTTATLSLAEPLTATCLGVLILGEHLSLLEWGGVVCLFAGIVLLVATSFLTGEKR